MISYTDSFLKSCSSASDHTLHGAKEEEDGVATTKPVHKVKKEAISNKTKGSDIEEESGGSEEEEESSEEEEESSEEESSEEEDDDAMGV